mmetsp:Transcript_34218/g.82388  ORF Transcript_34218/g.82388 Transcript_34218/m.82388 type:complete len:83 (+) Transcript_34218:76-324(+)
MKSNFVEHFVLSNEGHHNLNKTIENIKRHEVTSLNLHRRHDYPCQHHLDDEGAVANLVGAAGWVGIDAVSWSSACFLASWIF